MARFDLSQIEGFKSETSAINVALPVGGAYLLQCALTTMDKRWNWRNGDSDLTDNEWDDLDEEIAELVLAIMTEVTSMAFPIGAIAPFPTTQSIDGFLLCDGDQYLRVDYPVLYALMADEFIVDADNFTVPDLTRTFIRGIGNLPDIVGGIGGSDTHTLTVSEMPSHDHALTDVVIFAGAGSINRSVIRTTKDMAAKNTELKGAGNPHNNLPAYMKLPFHIKAE